MYPARLEKSFRCIQSLLALASFAGILGAERLPVRIYSPVEGLPGIAVHRIVLDSKGFLWSCTNEGISRFDGFEFVNYGTRHGLPEPNANDLLETADGVYWVGTDGGLCRFANTPKRRSDKMEHKLISSQIRPSSSPSYSQHF